MARKMNLPGIIVPPLTPFDSQLNVDYDALRREVDYVVEDCHADAISVAAVETQEYQYLDMEEREELIRRTAEYADGRCYVIVGISHPSLSSVRKLTDLAVEVGADAVQLLAPNRPFGGKPTQAEIVSYFRAAAEYSKLPMVAYHNPGPGAEVSPETMVELAGIERVEFFKESSRDMKRVGRLIQEIDVAGLGRYLTTMEVLLPTLLLGGSGGTMPPPAASIGHEMVEAVREGDMKRAIEAQRRFFHFPGRWSPYGLAPLMKFALKRIGLDIGQPYPPFQPISTKDEAELSAAVDGASFAKPGQR